MDVGDAFRRGAYVIDLESRLGFFWETDLQSQILSQGWLVDLLNALYLYGHLPVIGLVALWLYLRHRPLYLLMRNAFLISAAIGLIVYFLYPVALPRLLPAWGFVDTISERYGTERPGTPSAFINDYAAIPSLHFGWNLLAALMASFASRHLAIRLFALVTPPATLASIVLTADHFFLDAAAGILAIAIAMVIALAVRRLISSNRSRAREAAGARGSRRWLCGVVDPEGP